MNHPAGSRLSRFAMLTDERFIVDIRPIVT